MSDVPYDDADELEDDESNVITQSDQGPPGPPGGAVPAGVTDTTGGGKTVAAGVTTWNRSRVPSSAGTGATYPLPTEATGGITHLVSWVPVSNGVAGLAPTVTAPNGALLVDPSNPGNLVASYTYVTCGESHAWTWALDLALYVPRGAM